MTLFLARFALAQEPPPLEVVEAAPADPEELLHLARERLRHGDYEGVRLLCAQAVELPGDHQRTAQYLEAMAYEYGGELQDAIALYDALVAAYPAGEVPDDLRFRRAECLGRLGRLDEARSELARLPRADRPPLDQLKIAVLEGTWDLELGKQRRGYRELTRALDGAEAGVGTYYQASARHALLASAVTLAGELPFEGSDRAKGKALALRAQLLQSANDQLAEIILTEETSFSLSGFVLLAHAYRALGHDLLNESPIRGLTDEQLALNRSLLEERVESVWTRATLYYDRGLQLAARMDWTHEPVPTMVSEYRALVAEVDALTR
ncbi:MAG: tetratricopeptide repeat protein [Myxococcota bacterium]